MYPYNDKYAHISSVLLCLTMEEQLSYREEKTYIWRIWLIICF